MAERMLKKVHGKVPTIIMRPSIIVSCFKEPFRGWTDTIAAGGGFTYVISSGIMKYFHADKKTIYDLIPCDFVTHQVIAHSAYHAIKKGSF